MHDVGSRWQWRRMFHYSRCVCFGCRDQQLTTYVEDEEADDSDDSSSRRGGVSYHRTDKKALYVRMLGDVKAQAKPEFKEIKKMRQKTSLQAEDKLLDGLDCSSAKRAKLSGRRLSSGNNGKTRHLPLTTISKDSLNLLDVQYMNLAMKSLSSVHDWTFNVFTVDVLTDGRSLFHMSLNLFFNCGFLQVFHLDVVRLMRCFALIETGYYSSNPYHNSVHAADVVQAMYCNLQEPKILRSLRPIEKMAAILSAASHDLDHPGVNQSFLIATSNPLCALYNNTSVLENHHWNATIAIIHESRVFEHFDRRSWKEVTVLMKAMILATDITRQQEILKKFREHLNRGSLDLMSNEIHRSFILQITLKCADICNPCRPWPLSKRWSEMICEEFFRQGDCEKKLGLPVAPFSDRFKSSVATIQTGFIANVVEPLFIEWSRFAPSALSEQMLFNLRLNRSAWKEILLQEQKKTSKSNVITIVAVTEQTSSSTMMDSFPQMQCKNAGFDDDEDKENVKPSPVLNDSDLTSCSVLLNDHLTVKGHRRHSLPNDRMPKCSVVTGHRRHSLPNCNNHNCVNVLATSQLSSLVECSSAIDENHLELRSGKKLNGKRSLHDDSTRSKQTTTTTKKFEKHDEGNRRRSEVIATTGCLKPATDLTIRRASYPLNHINDKDTSCNDDAGCQLMEVSCQTKSTPASSTGNTPTSSGKKILDLNRTRRKFSLTLAEDSQRTVVSDRKRSRSLATSTLLYPLDENMSYMKMSKDLSPCSWVQPTNPGYGLPNATSCLHQDNLLINHFYTSKILPKPILTLTKTAQSRTAFNSGSETYSGVDRMLLPSVVIRGNQVQTTTATTVQQQQQWLSSCPIIARTVDVHSRPPKGVSRKATSVFTSVASDGEVAPLLSKRLSCDDEI